MSDTAKLEREADAFIAWISTFSPSKAVNSPSDLSDGAALLDVLSFVDPQYFGVSARPTPHQSENWVLRFSYLKRLYRLITQYYADVLHQPTNVLDVPDLQAIAKDYNIPEILRLCRLTIAIAVQSEKNQDVIERIQGLQETYQSALMRAIEKVMTTLVPIDASAHQEAMTDDDHYYQIQSERSRILLEKETLSKLYQELQDQNKTLQGDFDDLKGEKDEVDTTLRELRQHIDDNQAVRSDAQFKAEIDRLRTDLQKSEDSIAATEHDLQKQMNLVGELNRKVEELQIKASEADRMKDKLDEYRHAADKLQKTENVMEKYKKKLQESAELRRAVKSLEEQNASLVDKNAALEEDYRKVASFKPLMESYKGQIADLEGKVSGRQKEAEALKFELHQATTRLKISIEEKAKDAEALELYQERVRELELTSARIVPGAPARIAIARTTSEAVGNLIDGDPSTPTVDSIDQTDEADLEGELNQATKRTTMTDLRLQIRSLMRELEAAKSNQTEASRVLVLENLLEDANRMKSRYEAEYLAAYRDKLSLQSDLDDIRSGKSYGDGPEAAIALRQRLNETVEELEEMRKKLVDLEVEYARTTRELTIAKSDLNLVNKDQLDILAHLRESVNEDKVELESEIERLSNQIRDQKEKNRMQLEQINGLLMEKVNLQGESIGQREKALEREKAFGDLRAVISGKDLPEEVKSRLLAMHEDNVVQRETVKTLQDKLLKAKQVMKTQDRMLKEAPTPKAGAGSDSGWTETESEYKSRIKSLEDDRDGIATRLSYLQESFRRERQLMLSAIHEMGLQRARDHLKSASKSHSPSSWLGQQRFRMRQTLV